MVYVASSSASNYDSAQIVAQRLDTGEGSVLIQGGTFPHYVPTGHLVYYRAGTIMAVPFDVKRLEVKGSPVPVVEGVMASGSGTGGAKFAVSANGTLVYFPGGASGAQNRLVWVDRKGIAQPIESPPHGYGGNSGPKLSPGGKTVAVMIQEQGSDAWVYDFARDTLTRLTFDGSLTNIAWTPDGKRVVYTSSKSGPVNIFWKPADGSGAEETLVTSDYQLFTGSFTPDGRIYIYAQNSPKTGRDIWYESVEDRKPHVFLQTQFNETAPRLSPDGRYVAYSSDESGRNEIYVQPFPGPGGKYQISTEGGRELTWGANGEIFYRNGEKMMAVEVKTQPALQVGKAQMLFEAPYLVNSGAGAYYDVTADGQRFVMLKGPEQATPATQINVVLNWFEELKQKVPVR
jgi:hypothetical protein